MPSTNKTNRNQQFMANIFKTRNVNLNSVEITRVLPRAHKRMIGPFIFIDQMGPVEFASGKGLDAPPHPHIGLSTLTYMFQGSFFHQDNLGNSIKIQPGDVNWMTAGKGIVHSERQTDAMKANAHTTHGLQCWVALPYAESQIDPSFLQIKKKDLPVRSINNVHITLVAGSAYGLKSEIPSDSEFFFLDIQSKAACKLAHPNPEAECLLYLLEGTITIEEEIYEPGQVLILDQTDSISSNSEARYILLGGKAWSEIPYIDWNFVSFNKADIEKAKDDWRHQRFPKIPQDDEEYMPLIE